MLNNDNSTEYLARVVWLQEDNQPLDDFWRARLTRLSAAFAEISGALTAEALQSPGKARMLIGIIAKLAKVWMIELKGILNASSSE